MWDASYPNPFMMEKWQDTSGIHNFIKKKKKSCREKSQKK